MKLVVAGGVLFVLGAVALVVLWLIAAYAEENRLGATQGLIVAGAIDFPKALDAAEAGAAYPNHALLALGRSQIGSSHALAYDQGETLLGLVDGGRDGVILAIGVALGVAGSSVLAMIGGFGSILFRRFSARDAIRSSGGDGSRAV